MQRERWPEVRDVVAAPASYGSFVRLMSACEQRHPGFWAFDLPYPLARRVFARLSVQSRRDLRQRIFQGSPKPAAENPDVFRCLLVSRRKQLLMSLLLLSFSPSKALAP
jgi:hypothetical protein